MWYTESSGLNYKVCNGSGEDPSCADSVSVIDFSVADHLVSMHSVARAQRFAAVHWLARLWQVYLDLPICGCKPLGPMPM